MPILSPFARGARAKAKFEALIRPPGGGKSHLAAALGFAFVENGWRVLFTRTIDLVQRLQICASRARARSRIAKLDKFHLRSAQELRGRTALVRIWAWDAGS